MVNRLDYTSSGSLSQLEISEGKLVAFEGGTVERPQQMIMAITQGMYEGHKKNGRKLVYLPDNGRFEDWTFEPKGDVLELMVPAVKPEVPGLSGDGWQTVPNFRLLRKDSLSGISDSYVVSTALVGLDAINEYLQQTKDGMGHYAECIQSGKLVTQRNIAGKALEALGFGTIMPNIPRFRKFFFF